MLGSRIRARLGWDLSKSYSGVAALNMAAAGSSRDRVEFSLLSLDFGDAIWILGWAGLGYIV